MGKSFGDHANRNSEISLNLYDKSVRFRKPKQSQRIPQANAGAISYRHYRNTIDSLILDTFRQLFGLNDNISTTLTSKSTCKSMRLRVAEICAGDGSLASKLLSAAQESIRTYTMFDRNAELTILAKKVCDSYNCSETIFTKHKDVLSNPSGIITPHQQKLSNIKRRVKLVVADLYSPEGISALCEVEPVNL